MLKVPELRPGEMPFDPDRHYPAHPGGGPAGHALRLERAAPIASAIPAGQASEEEFRQRENETAMVRRLQAIRERNAVFDDANVRNALTDLHERGDDFERRLCALSGQEIAEIPEKTDVFLKEQRSDLGRRLKGDRQTRMFELGFAAFAEGLSARTGALLEVKTRAYRDEVSERQNRVFLEQALRPVNVFDDRAQTGFRDMYLLNLDNLHADLPDAERRARLDAAAAEFCRRVLDKRLELDPGSVRVMLDSPAVRRVLGREDTAAFEARAAAALRIAEIRAAARAWRDAGLDPAAAADKARSAYPDAGDRDDALAFYRHLREKDSRAAAAKNLIEAEEAWRDVMAEGAEGSPRLQALYHTDPGFARSLESIFRATRDGRPPRPDHAFLLRLTDDYDSARAAEELRDRDRVLEVLVRLGGPESAETGLYLRWFQGEATDEDRVNLERLRLARDMARENAGEGGEEGEGEGEERLAAFLDRFTDNVRIHMVREDVAELTRAELRRLVRQTLAETAKETADPAAPQLA